MKLTLLAGLIAVAVLVGCKKTEEGGVTGKDTFKLVVPSTNTDVKQGETALVRVEVKRSDGYKEAVKLEVKAPTGLQIDPDSHMVKPGDKEGDVQLKVTAAKDAPLGEQKILVKATPDQGEPAELEFKVTVVAK